MLGGKPYCFIYHVQYEKKDFALKICTQPLEQFINEVQYLKKLNECGNCDHIPQMIYEGIELTTGKQVMITDVVGEPISKMNLPFTSQMTEKVFHDIFRALTFIHQANYVYCDLHPGNVLMKEDENFVLIDFGAVALKGRKRKFMGTIQFCSIDSISKRTPTPLWDLESLIYLYVYLQTGTLPWWKEDDIRRIGEMKLELLRNVTNQYPFLKDAIPQISQIIRSTSRVKLKDGICTSLGIMVMCE